MTLFQTFVQTKFSHFFFTENNTTFFPLIYMWKGCSIAYLFCKFNGLIYLFYFSFNDFFKQESLPLFEKCISLMYVCYIFIWIYLVQVFLKNKICSYCTKRNLQTFSFYFKVIIEEYQYVCEHTNTRMYLLTLWI